MSEPTAELPEITPFGEAIHLMRKGYKVYRKGWHGKGIFIAIKFPEQPHNDKSIEMTAAYIYMDTTGLETTNPDALRMVVPWLASQADMLADDWKILKEEA